MRDPLGLIDEQQDQTTAAPQQEIQAQGEADWGYDEEELDKFYNTPVTVTDTVGALTPPEKEEEYRKKNEAANLIARRDAAFKAADKIQAGIDQDETGWQEPAEDARGLARNITGDILGVLAKAGSGLIKGATLGVVDPGKGTINVPFTSKKIADYAPPLDASLKDMGVSKEIAQNRLIEPITEFAGVAAPWTGLSKLYSWASAAVKARKATTAVGAAGEAAPLGTTAKAGGDWANAAWERAYKGTGERIASQAAVGATVGAARVKESPEESVIMDAVVGGISGAAFAGVLEIAHRAASAAGLTKFGAYLNIKAELSELLHGEMPKMSRAEADTLADYLIQKARLGELSGYRASKRWEQAKEYRKSTQSVRRPGSGETVDAEYAPEPGADASDVPDFTPPGSPGSTQGRPGAPGPVVPSPRPTLPPGQGFSLEGPPRDIPLPMEAAYGPDMPPGAPPHPGAPYREGGIPIEVMRRSTPQIPPPPEDLAQGPRALPPGERGFTLKGPPYQGSRPAMMTPMYDLRYEPGREGEGFILTGPARGEGPPSVIPMNPPPERGLLPPPQGQPPPSPPPPEDLEEPKRSLTDLSVEKLYWELARLRDFKDNIDRRLKVDAEEGNEPDEIDVDDFAALSAEEKELIEELNFRGYDASWHMKRLERAGPAAPRMQVDVSQKPMPADTDRSKIIALQKQRRNEIQLLNQELNKIRGHGRSPEAQRNRIDGKIRVLQQQYEQEWRSLQKAGIDTIDMRDEAEGVAPGGVSIEKNAPSPASKMPPEYPPEGYKDPIYGTIHYIKAFGWDAEGKLWADTVSIGDQWMDSGKLRRIVEFDGKWWTGVHSGGGDVAGLMRIVPRSEYKGTIHVPKKNRETPYVGRLVKYEGTEYVITGEKMVVRTDPEWALQRFAEQKAKEQIAATPDPSKSDPEKAPAPGPGRFKVSNKNMKKGYWKVVDLETGETVTSGLQSKEAAEDAAKRMDVSAQYPQPTDSDSKVAIALALSGKVPTKEMLPFQGRASHELRIDEWWDDNYLRKPYGQLTDEEVPTALNDLLPGDRRGIYLKLSIPEQREKLKEIRDESIQEQIEGKGFLINKASGRKNAYAHYKTVKKAIADQKYVNYSIVRHYPDLIKKAEAEGLLLRPVFKQTSYEQIAAMTPAQRQELAQEYGFKYDKEYDYGTGQLWYGFTDLSMPGQQSSFSVVPQGEASIFERVAARTRYMYVRSGQRPDIGELDQRHLEEVEQYKKDQAKAKGEEDISTARDKAVQAVFRNWQELSQRQEDGKDLDDYSLVKKHFELFRKLDPAARQEFGLMIQYAKYRFDPELVRRAKAELEGREYQERQITPPPTEAEEDVSLTAARAKMLRDFADKTGEMHDLQRKGQGNLSPVGYQDKIRKLQNEIDALGRKLRGEPEPEPPKPVKPVWEMTLSEYLQSPAVREHLRISPTAELTDAELSLARMIHMGVINDLLKEGKPVHGSILADYPDLGPHIDRIEGMKDKAKTAEGTEVNVTYALVKLRDLVASHDGMMNENPAYPQRFQNRNRNKEASKLQLQEYTGPKFEPRYYGPNFSTVHGAPIILPTGIVISGNMRTMTLQNIDSEKLGRYRDYVNDQLASVGITRTGEIPADAVLVRIIDPSEIRDLRRFAEESNKDIIAGMSATDIAKQDASRITPDMLDVWETGSQGNINAASNRAFINRFLEGVVSGSERESFLRPDGSITKQGLDRIRAAMFQYAYQNAEALEVIAESPDDNVKNITNALIAVSGRFARLRNLIAQGAREDVNIADEVAAATMRFSHLRDQGMPVQFYFDQTDMFSNEKSGIEKELLRQFDIHKRSSVKIRNILQNYLDAVDALGDPRTESMFDDLKRPTREEILQSAINYEEKGREPKLFDDTPTGGGKVGEAPAKYEDQTSTPEFKKWFGASKVRDPEGNPIVVYTGHRNVAVIGDRFRFARATAGAFYFSQNPSMASNYALGKWGQMETYENGSQYMVFQAGKPIRIWDYILSDEQVAVFERRYAEHYGDAGFGDYIKKNAPYESAMRRAQYNGGVRNLGNWWNFFEWMGDNIAYPREARYEDEPWAFRQQKNTFEELMDEAGIRWNSYLKDQPGVYPVYLRIEKPFDIDEAIRLWNNGDPQGVLRNLWNAGRLERHKPQPYEDKWTRDYPLKNWIDDLVEHIETGKDSYWATQVPTKARRILMENGYDGIKDLGGKMGGPEHIVWIAFTENQIKSAIGNKGKFSLESNSIVKEPDPSEYQMTLDLQPEMTEKILAGATELGLNVGEIRPRVHWVALETVGVKGLKTENTLDAALIGKTVAGMDAQEQYLYVVTNEENRNIALFRYSRGAAGSAHIDPALVVGQILNVPGAANVWFMHNHPAGSAKISAQDQSSILYLEALLTNTPVKLRDFIAVTHEEYQSAIPDTQPIVKFPEGEAEDALQLPVLERRFAVRAKNPTVIQGASDAWKWGQKNLPEGGIILLNSQLRIVATVKVPDLTKLSGEHHIKILQEAERGNATRMIAVYPNRVLTQAEARTLREFEKASNIGIDDIMDRQRSWREDMAMPHAESAWFHPNTVAEEFSAFKAGSAKNPIDLYVDWLVQKKRLVPPHDGKSLTPPETARPMISAQPPPEATKDISIWTVGQSPHHVLGRVWSAKDSPVIDALEASMTFQQNIQNDDRWAGAVLNHAGITNEVKKITEAVKPLFEKNRALVVEYAKLEGRIATINAQLRKIPIHQAYDSMEKEVRRLERLITKIDKHIGNLKTEKAVRRWEATRRRTIKMIERRMEKLSAIEIKYMRVRQINDLRKKKADLKAQQVQLLPGFQKMEQEYDVIAADLAKKYADVRVYLAAEDNLPPGIKLSQEEQEAVGAIKQYMTQKRDALQSMMIPTLTDKAYMTHLWRELLEDDAVRIFAFGTRRTPAILAFVSRLPNSRAWIPSTAATLKAYIPTVNFKLSYQPVLNRWRPVIDETMETNLRNYLQAWITENVYKKPQSILEMATNALVSFEYVRLIGLSMSVGFKHLLKLANTWAVYGPSIALPATTRMALIPMQTLSEKFGGKTGAELRAIRAFVTQRSLVRALDEIPGLHRAVNRFKLLMGQPVVAVEYFDNGVSILAGIIKGFRRDLDLEAIQRGIWETILDANFRAGWDQPLWQKRWGVRAMTMFQMTPFKLFEMKVKLIENAIRGKKDAFGTNYGTMLLRFLLIIGAAEAIARANKTSVLEMFLHFPFIRDLFHATKKGYEIGHPKPAWPPTAQMIEDWKDKGFKEGLVGTHEDWGIITKEYKAQKGKYSKQKYAGPMQYRLGLPRLGYEEMKARQEEERREKERAKKPPGSTGPFNLRKAYQTTK